MLNIGRSDGDIAMFEFAFDYISNLVSEFIFSLQKLWKTSNAFISKRGSLLYALLTFSGRNVMETTVIYYNGGTYSQ